MQNRDTKPNVAQMFQPVKPNINSQLPLLSDSVIHHNDSTSRKRKRRLVYKGYIGKRYGVSLSRRILSPQILLKKFDYVNDCLRSRLGLPRAEREAALRLLRYWAYYGNVYVKCSQVTAAPGCSKATYWRMVRYLSDLGLIDIVNRFIIRPHAQISNLYLLDNLCKVIARYLADHGSWLWGKWLEPLLEVPGLEFWGFLNGGQFKLPLPVCDACTA